MAMMFCPECGKQVSDKANVCIHCGYPIQEYFNENNIVRDSDEKHVCSECGKVNSLEKLYCEECGHRLVDYSYSSMERKKIVCPYCSSDKILIQQVTQGAESKTKTKVYETHHGCLYWVFVGWWIWMFKALWDLFLIGCTGGLSIFFKKKKQVGKEVGNTTTKNINTTVATCQNCGKTFNV